MQGIFINYRRQDSQSAAGRLADHIKENLTDVPVFRDVETIEPGVDFIVAINRALESCGVLLAVIGPHWLTLTDAAGRRRLDNPHDYTRLEITTALKRNDVRVIPVLVEGAQMPEPDNLPEDLQPLCRRNAIELTDKRWNFDVSQLIDALRKALNLPLTSPQPQPTPRPGAWYRRLSKKQWGSIAAVIIVWSIFSEESQDTPAPASVQPESASSNAQPAAPPPQLNQVSNLLQELKTRSEAAPPPSNPTHNSPAPQPALSGTWQDAGGGRYQLIEQSGGGFRFEGTSPHGAVVGVAAIVNNILTMTYTQNGVQYGALFEPSPDGNWLRGAYASVATGESGIVVMQRIP